MTLAITIVDVNAGSDDDVTQRLLQVPYLYQSVIVRIVTMRPFVSHEDMRRASAVSTRSAEECASKSFSTRVRCSKHRRILG